MLGVEVGRSKPSGWGDGWGINVWGKGSHSDAQMIRKEE